MVGTSLNLTNNVKERDFVSSASYPLITALNGECNDKRATTSFFREEKGEVSPAYSYYIAESA